MTDNINQELFDFISACPTAFHTAQSVSNILRANGYTELFEYEQWDLKAPGKYFVTRNHSAVVAFNIPKFDYNAFMLMAAHGDSPSLKVKQEPECNAAGFYTRLNIERYGGPKLAAWFDRPLSLAGRVVIDDNGRLHTRLVDIDRDLLIIPSLAIHMDRSVNDGKPVNANVDMLPLMASNQSKRSVFSLVSEKLGVPQESIVTSDFFLYNRQLSTQWGADDEFISAPRLDDLQCVFALVKGFLAAEPQENINVLCVFDNEEVGSSTKQGADSSFLRDVLISVNSGLGHSDRDYRTALAKSFMVSADNAHATHPNYPEYADRIDRPKLNGGIVIKYNANQRYTTDAVSAAVIMKICERAGVPYQRYTNRADIKGGSTLGNIVQTHVSLFCVDIGIAQLAMHSTYETAGAYDTERLMRAAAEFYGCNLRISKEGFTI